MTGDGLRTTPLTGWHEANGARMAEFAGWRMPLRHRSTDVEHRAVRTGVGVFDVSHLGRVLIEGPGAVAAVAAAFTNDAVALEDGRSQYTLCCTGRGGIVDDLLVYRLAADRLLAVPNAANTAAVRGRLEDAAAEWDATVGEITDRHAMIAVQGPDAPALVGDVLDIDPEDIAPRGIAPAALGDERAWVCRTGYTGEAGCELIVPAGAAEETWQVLVGGGAEPAGLSARDTLRLEAGLPLHGQDLTPDTNPFEARLGWAVVLDREAFTGQQALREVARTGPSRRLWGLAGTDRRPPRPGMTVAADGSHVGTVTSGGAPATLDVGIGLAYLDDPLGPGDEVTVDVRGTDTPFRVVDPPDWAG